MTNADRRDGHAQKAINQKTQNMIDAALKGSTSDQMAARFSLTPGAVGQRLRHHGLTLDGDMTSGRWRRKGKED